MKQFRVRYEQDDNPSNPREEFDHVGTMACWHRRYYLGDKHESEDAESYLRSLAGNHTEEDVGEVDMEKVHEILEEHYMILPLYLYDHSGITMSCSSFSCPWDSGQVGFIYCSLKKAKEEGVKDIEKCLRSEVEEYDQYLTGDVWGYIVERKDDESEDDEWEHEDSCWGFFGEDFVKQEGESMLKWHLDEQKKYQDEVEPFLPGILI